MKNREIAIILNKIANLLEMKDVGYKPRAYRNAAKSIENLGVDIEHLYKQNKLQEISGVGRALEKKIVEFLETGRIHILEELQEDIPVDVQSLLGVEGLGLKRIERLYQKLGIKTLNELEQAAKENKIKDLEGFGDKIQQTIIGNISAVRRRYDRYLLDYVQTEAQDIVKFLAEYVDDIAIAGSLRRWKETIGDVDILVVAPKPKQVIDLFTQNDEVQKILAQGNTKSSVKLYSGLQVDLRIVEKKSFGSALQYFTGSKEHNVNIRKLALKHSCKLNEYGLFKGETYIAGATEDEIYHALGMQWIPPELRESRGEVKAALHNSLPLLVQHNEVRGDLHIHTDWSDGSNSIAEMVQWAVNMGHEYIAITDHAGSLKVAGGMNTYEIENQAEAIGAIRDEHKDIHIFHGVEANIMKDGRIDIVNDVLELADIVVASIHSAFRMNKKDMTKRLATAIEHPFVNIIAHPTCRILQKREPIQLDKEKIFQAAKDNNVVMEINASPERLDLNDIDVKMAVEAGVKLSVGTDAHRKEHLCHWELGISVARRGWATKDDIINTFPVKQLQKMFN